MLALVWVSLFVFALRRTAAAAVGGSTHVIKEYVQHPQGWVRGGTAPPEALIRLRIGLPQSNYHILENHLLQVSDPDHARYGAYLSQEEVKELLSPTSESINAVDNWLTVHGLTPDKTLRSPANDWVSAVVPVRVAETMLNTTYHVWTHEESGHAMIRSLSYSVPRSLFDHVEVIQPTTMFMRPTMHRSMIYAGKVIDEVGNAFFGGPPIVLPSGIQVEASCNITITISCIQQLYNISGFTPVIGHGNTLGINGFLGQNANFADLQLFFADQAPQALNTTPKVVLVNGGQNLQNLTLAGEEADLDTQLGIGLMFPTPVTFFSTGGSPPFIPDLQTPTDTNEPYTDWLDFILSSPNPPPTITTSYGDDEQTVPVSFAQRACKGFAALGALGVSVIFSSGDGGVGDGNSNSTTQQCFTNDGRNVTRFIPQFPASCPFVTSVGGTISIPEVAVSFSGGGFSNVFGRPAYQEFAVLEYLSKLPAGTFQGLFNPLVFLVAYRFDSLWSPGTGGQSRMYLLRPSDSGYFLKVAQL